MDAPVKRIPTGVADFDSIVKGGMPVGSVVLLLGDLGAGQQEYVLTSAAKISLIKENPDSAEFFLGHSVKGQLMPESIHYITFSRSKEDILQEIEMSFNVDFYESFERNVIFKDFSSKYYRQTLVPKSWSGIRPPHCSPTRTMMRGCWRVWSTIWTRTHPGAWWSSIPSPTWC